MKMLQRNVEEIREEENLVQVSIGSVVLLILEISF